MEKEFQWWGFRSRREFASCLRGGGRGRFWAAGGVRRQVAGPLPGRQPGTGTRRVGEGAVTPSLHPEVPGIQFASPGYGLDIRQSMGYEGVWNHTVGNLGAKHNARTCMFPANLDHLRVESMKRCSYKTAWVTPGRDCLWSYKYGRGAAVRPQTNNSIWDGVIGLWCRVAKFLSPWCARGNMPTWVYLNRYAGPRSCIRWHCDNESLFGPPNQPKLTVSMSLNIRWNSRFVADRVISLRLRWIMVTSWSWMVQRNWSVHIARCLGCRFLGLTLLTAGLHNKLRPVHLQA